MAVVYKHSVGLLLEYKNTDTWLICKHLYQMFWFHEIFIYYHSFLAYKHCIVLTKKEFDLMSETTLNLLEPGSKAKVIQITGRGSARRRILDMGMVPGAEIEVIRKAPMGDPLEFLVKGYNLSLRKAEAELIVVQPLGV